MTNPYYNPYPNPYGYNYNPNPYPMPPQAQPQQPAPQQSMTRPTITATIAQVAGDQEAVDMPVSVGDTQMMQSRDGNTFYVKTLHANGEIEFDAFDKRPKTATPAPYVSREEYNAICGEIDRLRSEIAAMRGPLPAPAVTPPQEVVRNEQ